jgi:hypothetical protein
MRLSVNNMFYSSYFRFETFESTLCIASSGRGKRKGKATLTIFLCKVNKLREEKKKSCESAKKRCWLVRQVSRQRGNGGGVISEGKVDRKEFAAADGKS